MMNKNIIYWFELLVKQLQFYVDHTSKKEKIMYAYKLASIKKSLEIIKHHHKEIHNGDDLKGIRHIGKGTIRRINEILQMGKLNEVKHSDINNDEKYIKNLTRIFGIGRKIANKIYIKYGIQNVDELRQAVVNKKLHLPDNILKGIKYVDKIKFKIKRREVKKIAIFLQQECKKIDEQLKIKICGSYRRKKKIINDIDVIICHPNLQTQKETQTSHLFKKIISHLFDTGFMIDSLTSVDVPTKFMGICKYSNTKKVYPLRRIDIRFVPYLSYYTALLYFTGSKKFNRKMRGIAKSMGYILNEYYIANSQGEHLQVNSEKHIFDILQMEYVEPSHRN